jgi:outer membrane receptor for ferrienterochelin and colicins
MKIKATFACIVMLIFYLQTLHAQSIKGSVMDSKTRQPLIGATLHWAGTTKGGATDANGVFEISYPIRVPATLVVSYVGYINDSIAFKNQTEIHVFLKQSAQLDEVEIVDKKESLSFSSIQTMNRQTLSTRELQKAACCNLSESFETNATVDVSYANALTGAKQIKMLGLDGAYTQTMIDLQPGIRGLSNGAGWAHIPGTWVHAIDITKGVGSVVYGYESMAGQINIEMQKPEKNDRLFVNLYAGDIGRYEANVHISHQFNKHWSTILLTHASTINGKNDFNNDGFLDMATGYQYTAYNKWRYDNPGKLMASFGVFAGNELRSGGQLAYKNKSDIQERRFYGVEVVNRFLEAFAKASIGFKGQPYKGISLTAFARHYENQSMFGFKNYTGIEQTANFTATYQSIILTSEHKIKAGTTLLIDQFDEKFSHQDLNYEYQMARNEFVPGVFTEYQYDNLRNISIIGGLRADYHNMFGLFFTPRAHFKYNFNRSSALRLSAGSGFRTANIFIDHQAALASNRRVVIDSEMQPERAWNYGASLTHKFKLLNKNATWVADYYYTTFQNRIVADMDADFSMIYFYNLNGVSDAHTVQSDFIYEPLKSFELRLAYKWQDPRITYRQNGLLTAPLVNRHRILFNTAYATKFEKWKFDATWKWFGTTRIPNNYFSAKPPTSVQNDAQANIFTNQQSPWYYTINAQVTRKFKHFELYVGGENLTNFYQIQQVIVFDNNVFDQSFDASQIWGPVMGRVFYTGMRFTIK